MFLLICVTYHSTPGGNTLSAAEHTCALIAAMARYHFINVCKSVAKPLRLNAMYLCLALFVNFEEDSCIDLGNSLKHFEDQKV